MDGSGGRGWWATGAAGAACLVACAALALQFVITTRLMAAHGEGLGAAVWRFLGYFTLLTNFGVAVASGAMALSPRSRLAGPRVRLAAAVSIAFVGLVYAIALRGQWSPTGWQAVADHGLHDVSPVLFIIAWALAAHGALKWRDALWGAAPAALYCVYALARGAIDGWYAYWFLDPARQSLAQLAASIAILLAALLIVSLAFVTVDKWLGRTRASPGEG